MNMSVYWPPTRLRSNTLTASSTVPQVDAPKNTRQPTTAMDFHSPFAVSGSHLLLPTPSPPRPARSSRSSTPRNPSSESFTQHVPGWISKVNELSEKKRVRAHSTASAIEEELENGDTRRTYLRILAFTQNPIRPSSPALKAPQLIDRVLKHRLRKTLPDQLSAPSRPQARLVVSSPATLHTLFRPVPASPMGNAWSGEHFWAPKFSPSWSTSTMHPDYLLGLTDPLSRAAYSEVQSCIQSRAGKIKEESEERSEESSENSCTVLAAEEVLRERNEEFRRSCDFPSPEGISTRLFELYADERRAMSSCTIASLSEMSDIDFWLQIDEASLQFITIIDHARTSFTMLRERRKRREIALSGPAYALVFALQAFEESVRLWREDEDDSDDEYEYGVFLKSIQEELMGEKEQARMERWFERRKSKGKAPSTLDLALWAKELKMIEEEKSV